MTTTTEKQSKSKVPIYMEVAEDLAVFPLATQQATHERFMRKHRQDDWLVGALWRSLRRRPGGAS